MVLHTFKLRADSCTSDLEMVIEQIKKLDKGDKVLVKRGSHVLLKGKRLRRDAAVAGFELMVQVLRSVEEDERGVRTFVGQDSDEEAVVFPRVLPGRSRQRNEYRRLNSTCWACNTQRHEKESDFKCCAKCFCACYCSEACQRAHWGEHKKVCKKLDRLKSLEKGAKMQILSLQLSLRANIISEPEPTIYLIMYALGEGPGRIRAEDKVDPVQNPPGTRKVFGASSQCSRPGNLSISLAVI